MRAAHELILGGQRSGKSRCAELRASSWLAQAAQSTHSGQTAVLLATATAGDAEMVRRIAAHQADRALRVAALKTVEVPRGLAQALLQHSTPQQLLVVDCLTLWLTNLLMPWQGDALTDAEWAAAREELLLAAEICPGPVVWVSNEIGSGLSPMGPQVRRFVDELGWLHQALAQRCQRVTLMVAGLELPIKPTPNTQVEMP